MLSQRSQTVVAPIVTGYSQEGHSLLQSRDDTQPHSDRCCIMHRRSKACRQNRCGCGIHSHVPVHSSVRQPLTLFRCGQQIKNDGKCIGCFSIAHQTTRRRNVFAAQKLRVLLMPAPDISFVRRYVQVLQRPSHKICRMNEIRTGNDGFIGACLRWFIGWCSGIKPVAELETIIPKRLAPARSAT